MWYRPNHDVDFDKDIRIDIDFNQNFDTDIKLDKDVNVDVKIEAEADVKGNIATLTFDVEAVGYDTLAELDFVVLAVEDTLSSVSGSAIAAVD